MAAYINFIVIIVRSNVT